MDGCVKEAELGQNIRNFFIQFVPVSLSAFQHAVPFLEADRILQIVDQTGKSSVRLPIDAGILLLDSKFFHCEY